MAVKPETTLYRRTRASRLRVAIELLTAWIVCSVASNDALMALNWLTERQ